MLTGVWKGIKHQQAIVMEQLAQIQETLNMLNYKEWYYTTAKKAGTYAVHSSIKDEDVPEEFREQRQLAKGLIPYSNNQP